jgi:membrane protein implicated in regulation of membrane protease activity
MLFNIYLFAMVLGGVLLLASIFTGGDGDADVDVDADVDADLDAEGSASAPVGAAHGSLEGVFTTLLSLRFWTFFGAFFGLTGLVLDGADLVPGTVVPLSIALGMGVGAGFVAVRVMRALQRDVTGQVATAAEYVGKSGRALHAFGSGELGKVRIELGGTTVDILAKTDEGPAFEAGDKVLVVEMQGHTAFVTRAP